VLSLSTLSTPTPLDDLKKCKEHPWEIEDDNKKGIIINSIEIFNINIFFFS
jgi:hypothetical protein